MNGNKIKTKYSKLKMIQHKIITIMIIFAHVAELLKSLNTCLGQLAL